MNSQFKTKLDACMNLYYMKQPAKKLQALPPNQDAF